MVNKIKIPSRSPDNTFMMHKIERQPQQVKKASNSRPTKPAGSTSTKSSKKRISKVSKSNNKIPANAKSNTNNIKAGKKVIENLSEPVVLDEDPLVSYKNQLENFQDYMEHRLQQIMVSDKIQKDDAERIMKKFHSAMIEERNAMKRLRETYGDEILFNSPTNYGWNEKNEEDSTIENSFHQLDDAIKQSRVISPTDQSLELKSEDSKEEVQDTKLKIPKKKKSIRITRSKPTKNNQANPRTTRSMKESYTTQTDSTRPIRNTTKLEGKTNDKKNDESSFVKRNEYASKLRNMSKQMSLGNRNKFLKNEKLMNILKIPTTDESSDNDLLLDSVIQPKEKIGMKKSKDPAKRKKEHPNFQNAKSTEEKERHDALINLLGEETLRRTYMQANKQGTKKTPIFR